MSLDEVALRDLDKEMESLVDPNLSLEDVDADQPAVTRLRRPSVALEGRRSRISQRLSHTPSLQSQEEPATSTYEETEEGSFYDRVHEDEIQYQALALWAFDGDTSQWQISFSAGDIIGVIDAHPEEDWWIGAKDDQKGYFPRTYVEVIKKDLKVRSTVSDNIGRLQTSLNM